MLPIAPGWYVKLSRRCLLVLFVVRVGPPAPVPVREAGVPGAAPAVLEDVPGRTRERERESERAVEVVVRRAWPLAFFGALTFAPFVRP